MIECLVQSNQQNWYMYFDRHSPKPIRNMIYWKLIADEKYTEK